MSSDQPALSVEDLVLKAISAAGMPPPVSMIRTILLQDRFFLGEKYRFDGGMAIWLAKQQTVEVYDDLGQLVRTAPGQLAGQEKVA
jgi:hypothetical protein